MMIESLLRRPDTLVLPERRPLKGRTIVTIGGGRGIGAAENILFANLGARVVTIHKDTEKEKRFTPILAAICATGSPVMSLVGDITDLSIQQRLLDAALTFSDSIYAVNINAAGGIVGSEEVATALNVGMPRRIIDLFLPHMERGGSFLYPESLWSQFYPQVTMIPGYDRVAATKHQAAQLLIAHIPRFHEYGVNLRRLSGHAVEGTMMIDLVLRKRYFEVYAALQATCPGGQFPGVHDMAMAAAHSLLDTTASSGEVLYVLGRGYWGHVTDEQLMARYIETINSALSSTIN